MTYPNRPPPPPPQAMGSTNMSFNTQMRFDANYLKTPLGILRVVLLVFNIIGTICISSSAFTSNPRGVLFLIVAIACIIYTGGILYCYTVHLVEKLHNWRWLKIEMLTSVALVFCTMVTATVCVAFGSAAFSAAGFFGYLCMVMYGAEAWLCVRALREGAPAQGTVLHNKQQHVVSPTSPPA